MPASTARRGKLTACREPGPECGGLLRDIAGAAAGTGRWSMNYAGRIQSRYSVLTILKRGATLTKACTTAGSKCVACRSTMNVTASSCDIGGRYSVLVVVAS